MIQLSVDVFVFDSTACGAMQANGLAAKHESERDNISAARESAGAKCMVILHLWCCRRERRRQRGSASVAGTARGCCCRAGSSNPWGTAPAMKRCKALSATLRTINAWAQLEASCLTCAVLLWRKLSSQQALESKWDTRLLLDGLQDRISKIHSACCRTALSALPPS